MVKLYFQINYLIIFYLLFKFSIILVIFHLEKFKKNYNLYMPFHKNIFLINIE
jgi:hypothetical protein